jgi:dye decolorizing peroxidase
MTEEMLWDEYDPDVLWEDEQLEEGMSLEYTLDGIFTKPESYPKRRVGFAGQENVEERLDENTGFDAGRVPNEDEFADEVGDHPPAELSMEFNDQYKNSLPRETNVTLLEDQRLVVPKSPGVFAQGTIQHVSKLNIELDSFYDEHDRTERRELMFSPDHDDGNTGAVGENLGTSNAPGDTPMRDVTQAPDDPTGGDKARETQSDREDDGVAGHAQKVACVRFDMETRITDEEQERLSGRDRDELLPAEERDVDPNSGIADYRRTRRRGNYVIPPLTDRSRQDGTARI